MPKFHLSCAVTVSAYTVVDADNYKDAVAIAEQRQVAIKGLGGNDENEEWLIEDADGLPTNIHLG